MTALQQAIETAAETLRTRRMEASPRVRLKASPKNFRNAPGQTLVQEVPIRLPIEDPCHGRRCVLTLKGPRTAQCFEQADPEGPDIGSLVDGQAPSLLG